MYTQHASFIIQKKITQDYSKSVVLRFFLGTQERTRNSRGKRVISVRANEVLLYLILLVLPIFRNNWSLGHVYWAA